MWPWIYRLIAALLALIGSSLASALVPSLRERLLGLAGTMALVGLVGVALVVLAVIVAAGPATRRPTA